MKKTKRVLAILIGLLLISLSTSALAEEVTLNLDGGDITIEMKAGGAYSVTIKNQGTTSYNNSDTSFTVTQNDSNTATGNTITIKAADGKTAKVTLSGVNIDVSTLPKAAVSTDGGGDVIIELKGKNTVKSGKGHAGVEKGNAGKLTIADDGNDGSLEATGGNSGAGIGGGLMNGSGSGITISGGEVKATGGNDAAGIGGGLMGSGSGITISGGEVKATGGQLGAGIGGGAKGSGSDIIITGGEVTATGGDQGAGIGGGAEGFGSGITISGGEVNATGGLLGAGIGGGEGGSGSGITISGGEVNATGGRGGAGIGGGHKGSGNNIAFSGKVKATVQGGVGDHQYYGAGAGIGNGGSFSNGNPVDGDDLHRTNSNLLNVSGLEPGAIIRCYKQGTGIPDSLLYEIPELPDGVVVNVKCKTNSDHAEKTYQLIAGSYDFGEVQGDTCEITVKPEKYVAQYNSDIGVEHKLDLESQPGKIKLKWDNQKWKLVTPSDVHVVFDVECENTQPPTPSPSTDPSASPTPTPGGGNGGGGYYHPTTTPVPVIVIPPKTGDMTVWQSILHFLGIR